jgi:LysR family transcriptional regulator, nod-box dependent transcriptional activator
LRYRGIDLNLLAALEVLLTERNVTRAAARLNLSQSATSSALARLREQLDDALLVQAGRELHRSPFAEEILPRLRAVLAHVDSDLINLRVIDPRKALRNIKIMASDYVALAMLGRCLAEISTEAPGISFDIVPVSNNLPKVIEDYSVDLLITLDIYISKQHPSALFFEDDYVTLACASNEALADRLTMEEFLSSPQVSVRLQRESGLTHDEWFLEQSGLRKATAVTVRSHALLPYFIVGTKRIATLHRRQASIFARQFPLRLLELPILIPSIREMFQWHQSNDGDPVLEYLRMRFSDVAKNFEAPAPAPKSVTRRNRRV